MKIMPIFILLLLFAVSCATESAIPMSQSNNQHNSQMADDVVQACDLKPIRIPKQPKQIPGFGQLDESTGLHVTGKAPEIDFSTYHLLVTGLVERSLILNYDELRCLPKVTADPLLVCRGYFEDKATWSGVLIDDVLKLASPLPQAKHVTFISADGYKMKITLNTATDRESFLAYELEGNPLPILHGFPLRAVIPKREGNYWVKWLVAINVS